MTWVPKLSSGKITLSPENQSFRFVCGGENVGGTALVQLYLNLESLKTKGNYDNGCVAFEFHLINRFSENIPTTTATPISKKRTFHVEVGEMNIPPPNGSVCAPTFAATPNIYLFILGSLSGLASNQKFLTSARLQIAW